MPMACAPWPGKMNARDMARSPVICALSMRYWALHITSARVFRNGCARMLCAGPRLRSVRQRSILGAAIANPSGAPMPLANTETSYGTLARAFHWLIALGILIMVPLGWIAHLAPMQDAEQIGLKSALFSAHKTLGVALFFLALLRIVWMIAQPKPAPLHPDRVAERLLADTVHWGLYAALVIVPLSGWVEHAATDGFAPILWPFGQDLPLVPNSPELAETAAAVHFLAQWLLVGIVALHILGAVKHAVIDRDP